MLSKKPDQIPMPPKIANIIKQFNEERLRHDQTTIAKLIRLSEQTETKIS